VAWSPDGSRIAIFNHADGQLDDAIYFYDVATGEAAQQQATGGECCSFLDWTDLTWGCDGFGYGEVNTGFDGTDPYVKIVYPGLLSARRQVPTPSPTNTRMAFTHGTPGGPNIVVATIIGTQRHVVAQGSQPDWQPLP